ncbi:3870_t:CDS:2, partial [Scutellospora calospora]
MEAAKAVTNMVDGGPWLARCIRRWANKCMKKELIEPDLRGRFPSKSFLHDELVSIQLAAYLRSQKFKVDPIMVKDYFEQNILPQLNIESVQKISVRTCRRWMHKLGFRYQRYQKGTYVDGHECPDVVEYRQKFLEEEHVWVTHDETTFYVYDGPHSVWGLGKEQPLRKKGLGSAVYVSDFITETIGSLKDEQEEARVMM